MISVKRPIEGVHYRGMPRTCSGSTPLTVRLTTGLAGSSVVQFISGSSVVQSISGLSVIQSWAISGSSVIQSRIDSGWTRMVFSAELLRRVWELKIVALVYWSCSFLISSLRLATCRYPSPSLSLPQGSLLWTVWTPMWEWEMHKETHGQWPLVIHAKWAYG